MATWPWIAASVVDPGPKAWLPNVWSKCACVSTTQRTGRSNRESDVGEDLLPLGGLGARVDDEQAVVAFDDDDGEVERAAAALVDAAGDGRPGGHLPSLAMRRERNPACHRES